MEVQLSENQYNSIKKLAEEQGLVDFDLKTTPGSLKGDNYLGIITTVSVKNHKKKLDLVLKAASSNEGLRKCAPIRKVFLREIYLYDTVFREIEKFEREEGVAQGFSGHPKMYAKCDDDLDEFLILENLKAAGYKLWNRKKPMDADHVGLVFKEYGKFHAISYALKEKRPQLYEQLSRNLEHVFAKSDEQSEMLKFAWQSAFKAIKGDRFATEALERHTLVAEKFLQDTNKGTGENSVILHGDCWCNNMLFKYADPNNESRPSKVCLIDWQISWIGSPVLDLSYFLFTCAPKDIICDYKRYLRMYHDSLSETLGLFKCDPDVSFPFSTLERHWQKYARYGVQVALLLVKFMLSDGSEVPDITEEVNSGKSFVDAFKFDMAEDEAYNRRILDLVTVSGQNNWI